MGGRTPCGSGRSGFDDHSLPAPPMAEDNTLMLASLTAADFAPGLDQSWRITDQNGNGTDLVLQKIIEKPQYHNPALSPRVPFNLLFRGPTSTAVPQGIYTLENEQAGRFEGILVVSPYLGPGTVQDDTLEYHVTFN
jgi:hypothetical protein